MFNTTIAYLNRLYTKHDRMCAFEADIAAGDNVTMATESKIRFKRQKKNCKWNETPPIPSWRLVAFKQHLNDRYQRYRCKQNKFDKFDMFDNKCSGINVENALCYCWIIQGIKLRCK